MAQVSGRRFLIIAAVAASLVLAGCGGSSTGTASSPTSTSTGSAGTDGGKNSRGAGGPAAGAALTGDLTVTNGFKPETNGFAFENYGKSDNQNLTAEQVRRFFGDSVCANTAGGTCTLTPPAQQWMDATNDSMNGGHCEGMAALAALFYKGDAKPSDFGADKAFDLKIAGNAKLATEIAYWFATQYLQPTQPAEMKVAPSEVIKTLQESFGPNPTETYTMGIYKTVDGKFKDGHAITPYGLVDKGDGKFEVAVYDNNFPGAGRALLVDTKAETWSYSTATNPSEPVAPYEGTADTKSLTLTPNSARLKAQSCPFCAEAATAGGGGARFAPGDAAAPTTTLFLSDAAAEAGATVTITDTAGAPLAGVTTITPKDGDSSDDAPSVFEIPGTVPFVVVLDGAAVAQPVTTDLTIIGAGYDLFVDQIGLDPGQKDTMTVQPGGAAISYQTTGTETPTIGLGFDGPSVDYAFALGKMTSPGGGAVEVSLDRAAGAVSVKNATTGVAAFAFAFDRIDETTDAQFSHDGVEVPAGGTLRIDYGAWNANGETLKASVDADGTTTPIEFTDAS